MGTFLVVVALGYFMWTIAVLVAESTYHADQRRKHRIERRNRPPEPELERPKPDEGELLRREHEALWALQPGEVWGREHGEKCPACRAFLIWEIGDKVEFGANGRPHGGQGIPGTLADLYFDAEDVDVYCTVRGVSGFLHRRVPVSALRLVTR